MKIERSKRLPKAAPVTYNRGPVPQPPRALPIDPVYDATLGAARRNLGASLLGAQHQRGQLGQNYGLAISPSGVVTDDLTNPYSRSAAYLQAYRRQQRATSTSLAAQGQLYTGSFQNARNENRRAYDERRDAMIRDFMARQQQVSASEVAARGRFEDEQVRAAADRVQRALADRPSPDTAPAVLASTPKPAARKPKPKAKAKPKRRK